MQISSIPFSVPSLFSYSHRLRLGVPVKRGGVKQVDAQVEGFLHGGDALGLVDGLGWRKKEKNDEERRLRAGG